MLKLALNRAQPGMMLALPIKNPQQSEHTLLNGGYILCPESLAKLATLDIKSVWVAYPDLDFLEEFVSQEVLASRDGVFGHVAETFTRVQSQSAARLAYDDYTKAIGGLVDSLLRHPKTALFLGDLEGSDDPLSRHSSAVAYLAVLMGLKLEAYIVKQRKHVNPCRAKELTSLGLGAMLHDVGVPLLDEFVRDSYTQTGDESDPEWQEHPSHGYRYVRGQVEPTAACCVLHHHQHFDGSGYAGRDFKVLSGTSIHIFARIVAVADHFDRLKCPEGAPERPTVQVLRAMLSEPLCDRFDPEVLCALVQCVPPFAPGSVLQLNNGVWAVPIEHHPEDPCRPTVQVIPPPDHLKADVAVKSGEVINLFAQSPEIHIVECDGQPVADYLFTPELLPEPAPLWC